MPYLTAEEYLARYGAVETTRLTDEARTGQPDIAKLAGALQDAAEEIDGYVASRYSLPLPDPAPGVLDRINGDLAREILHRTRPLPQVTANAEEARRKLREIAAGRYILPLPSGEPTPQRTTQSASFAPAADARIFNSDTLARF